MTLSLFMVIALFSLQCSSLIFRNRVQGAEVAAAPVSHESDWDRDRDADDRADGDGNKDVNCTKVNVAASCIETYDDLESYSYTKWRKRSDFTA